MEQRTVPQHQCEYLLPHWQRLSSVLQQALARDGGRFSLDDVWNAVQNEQAQFWPGQHSALVTEIKVFPRTKILHVWLAAGNLDEILRMLPAIKHFGRNHECSSISMEGRPGWAKVLNMTASAVTLREQL